MYLKRYRKASVQDALRRSQRGSRPGGPGICRPTRAGAGLAGWVGLREVLMTASADRPVSASRPSRSESRQADIAPVTDSVVARLVASGHRTRPRRSGGGLDPGSRTSTFIRGRLVRALAGELAPMAAHDEAYARAEVFIGPPGVGKTTTIAKIAARERAGPGRTLGIIAADGFGREPSNSCGSTQPSSARRFVSPALPTSSTRHSAGDAAAHWSTRPPIAEGRRRQGTCSDSLAGERISGHTWSLRRTRARLRPRIFDAYDEAASDRLILTKLDEAESLSPLLGLLARARASYFLSGSGQRFRKEPRTRHAGTRRRAVYENLRRTGEVS